MTKGDPLNDKGNELKTPEKVFEEYANSIVISVPLLADHRTTLHGMFQIGFEQGVASCKRQLNIAADKLVAGNDALAKAYDRMKSTKIRNDQLMKELGECTRKKANLEAALHSELRKNERRNN